MVRRVVTGLDKELDEDEVEEQDTDVAGEDPGNVVPVGVEHLGTGAQVGEDPHLGMRRVWVRTTVLGNKGGRLELPPREVWVEDKGLDPGVPWTTGSLPVTRRRVVHSSLGLASVDQGTEQSFVSREVAESYPGGALVTLDSPVEVGPPRGDAWFVATRALRVELTLQWSVDQKGRGSDAGLKPTIRECGFPLELLVCDEDNVLSTFEREEPTLALVLGQDAEAAAGAVRFYEDLGRAVTENKDRYRPMWTHEQHHSLQGVLHGTDKVLAQDLSPAAVAFDIPGEDEDPLPYGPHSPFLQDTELDLVEDVEQVRKFSSKDRGKSLIPTTLSGMVDYLRGKLKKRGRVVERYIVELARVFLKHWRVLLDPRPSLEAPPLKADIAAGATPTRDGLRRRVPTEALPGLNEEVQKLLEYEMLTEVAAAPGGGPPPSLWINGLVVTLRRNPPGTPPGTPRRVRMCLDCTKVNRFARTNFRTQLPNLEDHVASTTGQSLWTTLDSPNAYHQCAMDPQSQDLFGFCLEDMTGRMRYYKYVGCCFGFTTFPALFQERMEAVLSKAQGAPLSTARAFIDDFLLGSGNAQLRLSDVWDTPRERELVMAHINALALSLQGYEDYGMVVNLAKSDLLQEEVGVCGILTDGVSRRLDPERKDGWENLGKPPRVTLPWLQHVLGLANYAQPFLPKEYLTMSEPLFELVRQTCRAVAAAGEDKGMKKVAQGLAHKLWGPEHDTALGWVVRNVQESQVRVFLDYTKPVYVVADSSDAGTAACIGQYGEDGVFRVAYTMCKRFSAPQRLWSVGAREVYGLLMAMRKWWRELAFANVVWVSDHHNIVTSAADLENTALKRWVLELSQWESFTAHRVHRTGAVNLVADTLSRLACSTAWTADGVKPPEFSPLLRAMVRKARAAVPAPTAQVAPVGPPTPVGEPVIRVLRGRLTGLGRVQLEDMVARGRVEQVAPRLARLTAAVAAEEQPPLVAHRPPPAPQQNPVLAPVEEDTTVVVPPVHPRGRPRGSRGKGKHTVEGALPPPPRDPPPLRRAAAAAKRALHAEETAEPDTALVVFNNPHTHSISPFMQRIIDAQKELTVEQRQSYLTSTKWAIKVQLWQGYHILTFKGRMVVPTESTQLVKDILEVVHDKNLHAGLDIAAGALMRAHLFIPGFRELFEKYYGSCTCQHGRAPKKLQMYGSLLLGPRYWPLSHIYMDFAYLPTVTVGKETWKGVIIVVDACSRVCQFTAVQDMTAATAVKAVERWTQTWGCPAMVHSDGGSHFTGSEFGKYLARQGISFDQGTAEHHRARGMVERLVGKLKAGLVRLLPQGRLLEWPEVMGDLERRVNRMPHKGLSGVSPFDYLILGHRQRSDILHPLRAGVDTPQSLEDLMLVLQSMRDIADWCGEIDSLKRVWRSEREYEKFPGKVGDLVLRYVSSRENSLEPFYQGPFRITQADGSGFYTVCELLANDALGVPVEVHASRLIMFDGSRTSGTEEHARKLDADTHIVEEILAGPREEDGRFQVKWRGIAAPTWEPAVPYLKQVRMFKDYCLAKGLDQWGKHVTTLPALERRVRKVCRRTLTESPR